MNRITVGAYEIALVTKRGKLVDVLTEGKHWVGFGKEFILFDKTKPISLSNTELELILENDLVKPYLKIVNIEDHELAIEMKDGRYQRLLTPGKVIYWNSPVNYTTEKINLAKVEVSDAIPRHILMKPEIPQYLKIFPVESYEKGLLYIEEEFVKNLDPGVYYYWKTEKLVQVKKIDTRLQSLDLAGQELLTKDKAGIRINFSAQYQVMDINKALVDTKDYGKQLYIAFQLSLRAYVGTLTLDELLADKESIGSHIVNKAKEAADLLGVHIVSGGIKDIILPGDMKDIMNQVLIAQKKAQANTIMRQEETASTRSLLNTAKLMEQNAMLTKLKEMEYMERISDRIGEITINGGQGVLDQLKKLVFNP